MTQEPPGSKRLFTPGPLTTSRTVKESMLRDAGSRDRDFIAAVRGIRAKLLDLGGVSQQAGYEAVLIQGSGTFGIEAVLSSAIPRDGKLLLLVNGAYGERMARIAERHGISTVVLRWAEDQPVDPAAAAAKLAEDPAITHAAAVHCETTTGLLNPIAEIGAAVRGAGKVFIADAMSSFGAVDTHLERDRIDFLISSANKCIEGVPGFSFVLARREQLEECKGRARTLSLDLWEQWRGLETDGQFRFTPPTHALLAFAQALRELDDEGGVAGRGRRYRENHATLLRGMKRLGFEPYLQPEHQSFIITAFRYPADERFQFEAFYDDLARRGMLIYPGKLGHVPCFRLGNIGRLFPADMEALARAIGEALECLGVSVPINT